MSSQPTLCRGTYQPLILVDRTSPVVARRRKQATITVTVRGHAPPRVTWHVGRNSKPISSATAVDKCFRCEDDSDGRHSLVVASVSGVLDQGLWVVADNSVGQDSCFIDVKTYRGSSQQLLFISSRRLPVTYLLYRFRDIRVQLGVWEAKNGPPEALFWPRIWKPLKISPPKGEKHCPGHSSAIVQTFTPIGVSVAEIYVARQKIQLQRIKYPPIQRMADKNLL